VVALLRKLPPWLEVTLVMGLAFGNSIARGLAAVLGAGPAVPARDPDRGPLELVLFELVALALILPLLHLRGWPLRRLAPRFGLRGAAMGVALCLAAFFLHLLLRAVLHRVLGGAGASPGPPPPTMSAIAAIPLILVNPVFEELLAAGYLITALERRGPLVAISAGILLRVGYHLYLGWTSALASMLAIGAVFGAFYWRRRQLGPLVVAHAVADLFAVLWDHRG
jgi:membrane protease YdiL (CAAX protease family)